MDNFTISVILFLVVALLVGIGIEVHKRYK